VLDAFTGAQDNAEQLLADVSCGLVGLRVFFTQRRTSKDAWASSPRFSSELSQSLESRRVSAPDSVLLSDLEL
jgi:hypothetical protein